MVYGIGMWLANIVFLPIAVFITYKASIDSGLFDSDRYRKGIRRIKSLLNVLKVLLLNNRVPYPLKDGGAKAAYSLIRGLAPPNVQLDCFFLNTKKHFLSQADIDQRFDFVIK